MRLLNIFVIGALILAASFVYKIKFDSTLQAARVAKLRNELRQERDAVAALRAEWAKLDTPARIEELATRFLQLQPVNAHQFDNFDGLPTRPPADSGATIPMVAAPEPATTGSVPVPAR